MSLGRIGQTSLMGLKPMRKREPVLIKELIGLQRLQQLLFLQGVLRLGNFSKNSYGFKMCLPCVYKYPCFEVHRPVGGLPNPGMAELFTQLLVASCLNTLAYGVAWPYHRARDLGCMSYGEGSRARHKKPTLLVTDQATLPSISLGHSILKYDSHAKRGRF